MMEARGRRAGGRGEKLRGGVTRRGKRRFAYGGGGGEGGIWG